MVVQSGPGPAQWGWPPQPQRTGPPASPDLAAVPALGHCTQPKGRAPWCPPTAWGASFKRRVEQEGGLPPAAGWVDLEDLVLRHCAEDKRGAGPCPRGPGVPDPDTGRRRSQGWGAEGSEGSVGSEVQAGTRGKFWRRWWRWPHSVTTLHASTHLQWLQRCILYHNTKKCPQKSQAGETAKRSPAPPAPESGWGGGRRD